VLPSQGANLLLERVCLEFELRISLPYKCLGGHLRFRCGPLKLFQRLEIVSRRGREQ
jgi:hypothetical protein